MFVLVYFIYSAIRYTIGHIYQSYENEFGEQSQFNTSDREIDVAKNDAKPSNDKTIPVRDDAEETMVV